MDRVQQMVSDAGRQVSSGLRVSQTSDDPEVISRLLGLHPALHKNTQITSKLGQAQTDANVSESALSSATQLMDQAGR
jgi:flagellin-like hook-associated protein FlgL